MSKLMPNLIRHIGCIQQDAPRIDNANDVYVFYLRHFL